MATTRAAGMGCVLRAFGAWVLFMVVATAVAVIGGYIAGWLSIPRAQRAWAEKVEPMETFIARYPTEPDSPAAVALDEKTRLIGIQMILPAGEEGQEGPHDELIKELGAFITDIPRARTDQLVALPGEARALLERERAHLAAIETQILEGGELRWEQNVTKGAAAPFPRLGAHRQIHNLLLARAWEASRRGRAPDAERALEASWVLGASLEGRPDMLSRLIAVAFSDMQNRVLRAVPLPEDPWVPRMRQRGFTESIHGTLQLEAWSWTRYAEGQWGIFDVDYMERGEKPPHTVAGDIGRFITAPYVRLSFAGLSTSLLQASQDLRAQPRCDFDVVQYSEELKESYPPWNILARLAGPPLLRAWTALRQADFDREFTERVLVSRNHRESSAAWPAGSTPSSVCADISWVLEPQSDGTLIVRPSEPPFVVEGDERDWTMRLRP